MLTMLGSSHQFVILFLLEFDVPNPKFNIVNPITSYKNQFCVIEKLEIDCNSPFCFLATDIFRIQLAHHNMIRQASQELRSLSNRRDGGPTPVGSNTPQFAGTP